MKNGALNLLFLCSIISFFLFLVDAQSDYSIVFVHIGDNLPGHLPIALDQARLFNNECDIYVLVSNALFNKKAYKPWRKHVRKKRITLVPLEQLPKSKEHAEFLAQLAKLNKNHTGFWLFTKLRFLYLNDFIQQRNLKHVIHLENDNMLYVDLRELMPVFSQKYPGLGITLTNDQRAIAGFVYIAQPESMKQLADFFVRYGADQKVNDMDLIGQYRNSSKDVETLPVVMESYFFNKPEMKSPLGDISHEPSLYCNNSEAFKSVFDASYLGFYIGGANLIGRPRGPGFIDESCVINASFHKYSWERDAFGRNVPFILCDGKKYRINNLHFHAKNLVDFKS